MDRTLNVPKRLSVLFIMCFVRLLFCSEQRIVRNRTNRDSLKLELCYSVDCTGVDNDKEKVPIGKDEQNRYTGKVNERFFKIILETRSFK